MIRALIFDMDGTLVDSEQLHYLAWKEALSRHGVECFPFDDFVSYVGTSNESVAEDYIRTDGLLVSVDALVQEKQRFYLEMIPDSQLLPGVGTIIKRFHGRYRLAVASSSHRLELDTILKTHGVSAQFEQVVGGDMVVRKKPDPEIYLKTCGLLGLRPHECVAFEDSESGVNAARSGGLSVVAIPHSLTKQHDFTGADRVVDRIDEVDEQLLATLGNRPAQ